MPDLTYDLELVRTIVKAGDGRKAEDIVGLQVAQVSTLTSFMVFLSGNSRPQNQAIAAAIADDVEEKFGLVRNPQGTADSGWMVLDYGSVMVHIMTPKSRLFYNVEGQVRFIGDSLVSHSPALLSLLCLNALRRRPLSHLYCSFLASSGERREESKSI